VSSLASQGVGCLA